jgi:hypothetical protein
MNEVYLNSLSRQGAWDNFIRYLSEHPNENWGAARVNPAAGVTLISADRAVTVTIGLPGSDVARAELTVTILAFLRVFGPKDEIKARLNREPSLTLTRK